MYSELSFITCVRVSFFIFQSTSYRLSFTGLVSLQGMQSSSFLRMMSFLLLLIQLFHLFHMLFPLLSRLLLFHRLRHPLLLRRLIIPSFLLSSLFLLPLFHPFRQILFLPFHREISLLVRLSPHPIVLQPQLTYVL